MLETLYSIKSKPLGPKMRKLYKDINLQIIFWITLMSVIGATSIPSAFPRIMADLQLSKQSVQLIIFYFTFPGVFLTPFFGILSDRIGRKKTLVPFLFLFGIAGGACFFAQNLETLLILRFLQGVGATPLGSLNVTMIGDLYEDDEQISTTAMGYNMGVLNLGAALFPILGGALAILGWFYPFIMPFIAIPIGIVAWFRLKIPEPKQHQEFKEYLKEFLELLKNKHIIVLFIAVFSTFILLYGPFFSYYPILLNNTFQISTLFIGMFMSVESITASIISWQVGKIKKLN